MLKKKDDNNPSSTSQPDSPPSSRDNEPLSQSSHGSPSKSALRAFKTMSISTAPLDISSGRKVPLFPLGVAAADDTKKKSKWHQQRVYFALLAAVIMFLLMLIIVSLEKLHSEEEMMNAAYPKRLEDFGFRATQLRATVKQLFLDGSLNLTMLLENGTSVKPSDLTSVIDASLERCSHQWQEKDLKTPCHGMRVHSAFMELAAVESVASAKVCKALCCELGNKCGSWQYFVRSLPRPYTEERICYLGGYVNNVVGSPIDSSSGQPTNTGVWCDALPPLKWRGRRLRHRQLSNRTEEAIPTRSTFSKDFTCEWGDELPNQCSGLGNERTITFYRNSSDIVGNLERLSRKQCAGK